MDADERVAFYASKSGLSKATVNRYRRLPASRWTARAEREQARVIRGLERLAGDPDLPWSDWRSAAVLLLREIRAFIKDVCTTVAEFVERVSAAIQRVLEVLRHIVIVLGPIVAAFS